MNLYRNFSSQQEIDSEYKFTLSVKNYDEWLTKYKCMSQTAIESLNVYEKVSYGPTVDETSDIYPSKNPDSPILLFVHGGYWSSLSSTDFGFIAKGFHDHNITVVVSNYSLCPKVSISEITRQTRALIAWIYKEGKKYNGDPLKIFVCGHSAGGQQVGMVCATDWETEYGLPKNLVKGAIPMSGIFDLRPLQYSYLQPKIQLDSSIIQSQSPCLNLPYFCTPFLIIYGELETNEIKRLSIEYGSLLKLNGHKSKIYIGKKMHHFSLIERLAYPKTSLTVKIINFIKQNSDYLIPNKK